MSSDQGQLALVVSTYAKIERFIPLMMETLDGVWPAHPPLVLATDGAHASDSRVVSMPGLNWVELLLAALERVREARPSVTHIFYMLEDHCPLRSVDADRMRAWSDLATSRNFAAVHFPTYRWPWNVTSDEPTEDGLTRTWRKVDVIETPAGHAACVPRDFFRYFQVQPTLWRLDYLIDACRYAQSQRIGDAWAFEALQWPKNEQHYVADYDWPTVHHGFLAQGRVNHEAIAFADHKLARRLRRQLMVEFTGGTSELRFATHSLGHRVSAFIRRKLPHLARS